MYVTAYRVQPQEEDPTERITVTFNFDNLASQQLRQHNTALMVAAVLAILDNYPGQAVLLFNGEHAVLERTDKEVVFDSDGSRPSRRSAKPARTATTAR